MIAATLILQLFSVGLAPIDLGKTPSEIISARACAGCHGEAHDEWRASRHGLAWTNPIFQREYQLRPNPWCVHCHAPLGIEAVADEGVNCAVCHVRDGKILAASHRDGSPHATEVRADFGAPAFCAGCHQFNFPRFSEAPEDKQRVIGYTRHPMQNTVAEHAIGPKRDQACRSCHAHSPGHHRYPGGHDRDMLTRALDVTLCRSGGELALTVRNRGAGHRVPTGDVHRHLVLRAWRPSAPEAMTELLFGRRFAPATDGGKETVSDTSLAPGESRTLRAPLGRDSEAEPLSVELRYVYTIDEFPLRPVGEPVWTTIYSARVTSNALAKCP